ncbi:hypothetical protein GYMLUDRAFT_43776 [Collybiopsis luxurians FD-317 M1]|uniref:choline-phosphate cytidylyltransferase n=1 Tax=Collybiopsis luxurians FD-317 M1 TaxID=944289 RepID=A0A0D0CNT7_9AGAR|nr:hypothetical protein GYMLUDRAFT_43776 [Collybiopsis luxurians FD-317 M1]
MDASSVHSDDLSDYDVVSDPGTRSLESSIADLVLNAASPPTEPPPTIEASDKFATVRLTPNDIQLNVRLTLGLSPNASFTNKTKRVYVDGFFDMFNAGHALQLRQAKLSFPSVHLICGVFSDALCESYGFPTTIPHLERCEVLRHCRWVDQVLPDAPWQIHQQFLSERNIDYIVVDEGTTVDPKCDKVRLKGYDDMKRLGKVISTKRTLGLTVIPTSPSSPTPLPTPFLATPKSPPITALAPEEDIPEPLVEF